MAADRGVHSVDTWPLPTRQPFSSDQVREKGQAVSRMEVSLFYQLSLAATNLCCVHCWKQVKGRDSAGMSTKRPGWLGVIFLSSQE